MRAGTSEKIITPEVGIELSGYLARMQPSTGKYDDLFARTLYLESAGKQLVWILCDLIGFSNELAWSIRNLVAKKLSIDPLYVVLSATHTHAGPVSSHPERSGGGKTDAEWFEGLAYRIAFAILAEIGRASCRERV